jgi:osmotically-inducible protein OsmY
MARSASLPILPAREPTGGGMDAVQAAAPLLTQNLEDLRLAERIERALRATGYAPLRGVQVTVHAGLVVLRGRFPTYYLKQVAQTTVLAVPGAHQVRSDLEVSRPS